MSDPIATVSSWISTTGHGTVQRIVALKGTLALSSGAQAGVYLCQTDRGAFLAAAEGEAGRVVVLAEAWPLGWDSGIFNDALIVGADRWVVPTGKGAEARLALALGRVAAHNEGPPRPVIGPGGDAPEGPWISTLDPVQEAAVARLLGPGDFVLAWLPTAERTSPPRAAADAEGVVHLLLTRDRAALVVATELGDVSVEPIDGAAGIGSGTPTLTVGDRILALPPKEVDRFAEVVPLLAIGGADRTREAAWRLARHGVAGGVLADRLLDRLVASEDPLVLLARAARHDRADAATLDRLAAGTPLDAASGERLGRWVEEWRPALTIAEGLLERLLARAEDPEQARSLIGLHRAVRARRIQGARDVVSATTADVSLAEHLLFAGEREEARAVLEQRLAALPADDLLAVAPPAGADLCAGEGGPPLHLRVLELLVHARGDDAADRSTLAALARHQPLLPTRLTELVEASSGDARHRAQRGVAVLLGDALSKPAPAPQRRIRPIAAALQERLQHPAAREGGALGRVQSALAEVVPPDASLVRSYCERLTERRHPDAWQAIAEAALMLGMPVPQAFISRGERDIGLRSHEKPAPFLLIGGAHLDPDSDHFLPPAELRFAVGAELAHLHFGHSRVSSDDVWSGVWDKTTMALGATATVLPFLRFLPTDLLGSPRAVGAVRTLVPDRWLRAIYEVDDAADLAKRLGADPARIVKASAEAADSASGGLGSLRAAATRLLPAEASADLGVDQERLVVAHRVMQLSADRVGLVLADDLAAALRAIFLTHSRLRPELALTGAAGLSGVLSRKTADGAPLLPHLTVRAAALIAFWLSDDLAMLRDAARAPGFVPAPPPGAEE
jgi:hypothetical protein